MRLWIGHYLYAPEKWFLVWARTRDEAIFLMDGEMGEPDVRSLKLLDEPGFIELSAQWYPGEHDEDEVTWGIEKGIEPDDAVYIEPEKFDLSLWVKKYVTKPFGPPKKKDASLVAEGLGIEQPAVMRAYYPDAVLRNCPSCGAPRYKEGNACRQCGHSSRER